MQEQPFLLLLVNFVSPFSPRTINPGQLTLSNMSKTLFLKMVAMSALVVNFYGS